MLDYNTTPNKTEYQIMPNYTPYKRIDYNASFVEEPKYVLKGTINQQLRDKTSIYLNVRSESSSCGPGKNIHLLNLEFLFQAYF